jgi:ligand-binding SRPBCC domain-containing protein
VREVSKHLHHFYVKHGICQLTDHAYDMSMSILCNCLVIVLLNKMLRCIIRHGMPVCAV